MALESGIVFHFKYENNWVDSFGNVNPGVPNGAGFVADDPVGVYSSKYDGINDYVVHADEPLLNPGLNDFTYAALLKVNNLAQVGHIVDKGFSTAFRIRIGVTTGAKLFVEVSGSGVVVSALSIPDTVNFHLVIVSIDRDTGASFFQIDNNFDTFDVSSQVTKDLNTVNPMVVGARDDGAINWKEMALSQFTRWGRFLSQAEGLEYYNGGAFKDLNPITAVTGRRRRLLIGGN